MCFGLNTTIYGFVTITARFLNQFFNCFSGFSVPLAIIPLL